MPGYFELRKRLLSIVDGVYDDENELVRVKMRWSEEEDEQAARSAVCARTKLTPTEWNQLRLLQERIPWLEEAIRVALLGHDETGNSRNTVPREEYSEAAGGNETPDAGTPPEQAVQLTPSSSLRSVKDLATMLRKPIDAVDSFLRRYRDKHPDCYTVNHSRRKNEPRYLYRVVDVMPVLKQHFSPKGNADGRTTDDD